MTFSTTPTAGSAGPAVAGVVAVGAGLAVGEIAAVPISPDASPYFAVGSTVVDRSPAAVRDWAIEMFGIADKIALFVGMGLVIAAIAAVCGLLERRRPPLGSGLIVVFALVGVAASATRPGATWTHVLPSVLAGIVAVGILRFLLAALPSPEDAPEAEADAETETGTGSNRGRLSRRFLLTATGIAAVAVAVGVTGRRMLADTADTLADRARLLLPRPSNPAPPVAPGVELDDQGVTSFLTDNDAFYRIDTALQVPTMTTADWRLRIHGAVDREVTLTWDELISMPMTERIVTLACVSNDVGGDLIGNARWLGVPMREVLALAGVQPGADMLLSTSVDGWTCGTPVSTLTDGRDALLAIGMNGEPLPIEHGYPVRQVVPGLYGYVSATKWVVDWELTSFAEAEAYWTTRGWSAMGPIKMSSRIDRPAAGTEHPVGEVVVAGTAWAQQTGIERVEVRVDGGPWQPAELAAEYSIDTWRQWRFAWQATPGEHLVECRAIDKQGRAQIEQYAAPAPDGATGLDASSYTIR